MFDNSLFEQGCSEMEALSKELCISRQAQADAEFARELAGSIVAKIASAVPCLPLEELLILDTYITKSLELAGSDNGESE